ncbi:MAG: FtsX-like permease family protein [Spirochaetales bacterium]
MKTSLFIALRYLSPFRQGSLRRVRGAIISIGLSLVPLIVVLEVSDGMIQGITARILELGTYHIQVLGPPNAPPSQREALIKSIEPLPEVLSVTEEVQGIGLLYSSEGSKGVTLRAVPKEIWNQDARFREYLKILEGEFDLSDPSGLVIGRDLSEKIGVGVGDFVRVITPYSLSGNTILSRVSKFRVAGIVSSGYQELDRIWAFISKERQRILSPQASRTVIGIKVKSPYKDLSRIQATLYQLIPPSYRVYTWEELERSRMLSFQTTRYLLLFIMVLIVVVSSVNISSTLWILQMEKREELAILKSYGFKPRQIETLFYCLGAGIGIVGAFLGTALGLGASVSINELIIGVEYLVNNGLNLFRMVLTQVGVGIGGGEIQILNPQFYLEKIPFVLKPLEVTVCSFLTILLSILSSVLPARSAARLKPLEVLSRH